MPGTVPNTSRMVPRLIKQPYLQGKRKTEAKEEQLVGGGGAGTGCRQPLSGARGPTHDAAQPVPLHCLQKGLVDWGSVRFL